MVPLRFSGLKSIKFEFFLNFFPQRFNYSFWHCHRRQDLEKKVKTESTFCREATGRLNGLTQCPPPYFIAR